MELEEANQQQRDAILCTNGPLLVLAGAGTGKTKLLVSRIAYIIANKFAEPSSILAVTFTNKAAREMKERIIKIVESSGLNIGTFHSIALSILRQNSNAIGLGFSKYFSVIDQSDQIKLIKDITTSINIDVKQYPAKLTHSIISRWKDGSLLPEQIGIADIVSNIHKISKKIYEKYQQKLIEANSMDFGDLIMYCNKLFIDNPLLLEQYQDKFRYILIDEYQDTNIAQYLWVRMLASKYKNICCVGDDDQSIYSWRGAEVGNILRFEQDFPKSKIIRLEQNYRSTSNILAAASSIIQNNTTRHQKQLWTSKGEGKKIRIMPFSNDREEARYIGMQIQNFVSSKEYTAEQIAILVRAGFQSRIFEEIFISNAIPYQVVGNVKFYERMEIRDILSYIRLAINMNDNISLERIINTPRRSIGNMTLNKIKNFAEDHKMSIFSSIKEMIKEREFKGKASENLEKFIWIIEEANRRYQVESALVVTKWIIDESGYINELKLDKTDDSEARVENIEELLRAINEFDNIYDFTEHSSLVMDNEFLESDFGGSIKIMTLHAAKGLEFDVVFLPGWEEGIFPHQKAINEEGEDGLEEERRIAYVGITRAKDMLFISHAESRYMFNEFIESTPSRFLSEIPVQVVEKTSAKRQLNYVNSRHNHYFSQNSSKLTTGLGLVDSKININDIRIGDKVNHKHFGDGVVLNTKGEYAEIIFDKFGKKKINHSFISKLH